MMQYIQNTVVTVVILPPTINKTVKHDEVPSVKGFKEHLHDVHEKQPQKLKQKKQNQKRQVKVNHKSYHVEKNKHHYAKFVCNASSSTTTEIIW
jgi:Sec-independent protein translocase protein TatA